MNKNSHGLKNSSQYQSQICPRGYESLVDIVGPFKILDARTPEGTYGSTYITMGAFVKNLPSY